MLEVWLLRFMYFPDFSLYQYELASPLEGVFHIGWLESGSEYPKGEVDRGFLNQLLRIILSMKVNPMRGTHDCSLCNHDPFREVAGFQPDEVNGHKIWPQQPIMLQIEGGARLLGGGEIWLPFRAGILAAPDLIYHYVEAHGYRPPAEFLGAVMSFETNGSWNPQGEYDARVSEIY